MFQFQLDRGGDVMKHCQKIKRKQRAHLSLMGMKHDMARQRDSIVWIRDDIGEGKGRRRCQLG
jgi:hypothetical protein